jgi:YidC/Oxa1 family membrane protein insertase
MQPQDNRNMIIAIVLSIIVLFGWQFFIANPQMEQAQQRAQVEAQRQADNALATPAADGATPAVAGATGAQAFVDRAAAIAASARVPILTESLTGSISLTGGRLDDLELNKYHETVDPTSPKVTLFTPAGAPNAFFAEQGWVPAGGGASAVPDNAVWTLDGANTTLTETTPVTIRYETSTGLVFRRTFTVDNNYLFTVKQTVQNTGTSAVSLFPFSRIARHDTPRTSHFFILQEGPYGVLGSENLVELTYDDLAKQAQKDVESNGGWLGFTDKYWAAVVLPAPQTPISARFSYTRSPPQPTSTRRALSTRSR